VSGPGFYPPDAERSRLRVLVAAIDRELSRLSRRVTAGGGAPASGLFDAWAALVDELALGPEPEVRECPVCGHIGMRAATRCGYCWTELTPPPERDAAAGAARGPSPR
jgi:hypothetical protein